jgi:hypothetical protein
MVQMAGCLTLQPNHFPGINHNNQWHFRSQNPACLPGFAGFRIDGNRFYFAANDR